MSPEGDERDEPITWHHGLMARWWAEFKQAEPDELAFYRAAIERFGEPALDLACGAGRLLVPLMDAGLDIDGADVSPDMLEQARRLAAARGSTPTLTAQPIRGLNLARRYGTIFICDSFGIGGPRSDDLEGLRRVFAHLEPGGALVFSHHLPYGDKEEADGASIRAPSGARRALKVSPPPIGGGLTRPQRTRPGPDTATGAVEWVGRDDRWTARRRGRALRASVPVVTAA